MGVEELDVPDAVHQAAPDAASLSWLMRGVEVVVVQVLHLTVGGSVPAQQDSQEPQDHLTPPLSPVVK